MGGEDRSSGLHLATPSSVTVVEGVKPRDARWEVKTDPVDFFWQPLLRLLLLRESNPGMQDGWWIQVQRATYHLAAHPIRLYDSF